MDWLKFWDSSNPEGVKTTTSMLISFVGLLFLAACLANAWQGILRACGLGFILEISPSNIVLGTFVVVATLSRLTLYSTKPLEKGGDNWRRLPKVTQFQEQFASKYLQNKYSASFPMLKYEDFRSVWFSFFNDFPEQVRNRTLVRGARCYTVFALSYEFLLLASAGLIATLMAFVSTSAFLRGTLTLSLLYSVLWLACCRPLWNSVLREFKEMTELHTDWLGKNQDAVQEELRALAESHGGRSSKPGG